MWLSFVSSPKLVLFYVCHVIWLSFSSLSCPTFVQPYVCPIFILSCTSFSVVIYYVCLVPRLSYTTFVMFHGCHILRLSCSTVVLVPIKKHFAGKITLNAFNWTPLNPDNIMNTFWSSAIFQLFYLQWINNLKTTRFLHENKKYVLTGAV